MTNGMMNKDDMNLPQEEDVIKKSNKKGVLLEVSKKRDVLLEVPKKREILLEVPKDTKTSVLDSQDIPGEYCAYCKYKIADYCKKHNEADDAVKFCPNCGNKRITYRLIK